MREATGPGRAPASLCSAGAVDPARRDAAASSPAMTPTGSAGRCRSTRPRVPAASRARPGPVVGRAVRRRGAPRVATARALYTEPDVLLLDEPTNHMDMPTIEWMEEMLRRHRGALRGQPRSRLPSQPGHRHRRLPRRAAPPRGRFRAVRRLVRGHPRRGGGGAPQDARRIAAETKWSREGVRPPQAQPGPASRAGALRLERARTGNIRSAR